MKNTYAAALTLALAALFANSAMAAATAPQGSNVSAVDTSVHTGTSTQPTHKRQQDATSASADDFVATGSVFQPIVYRSTYAKD